MNFNRTATARTGVNLTRRGFVGAGASIVAALGVSDIPATETGGRKRSLRIAHLNDVHVQPELRADLGMEACLRHVADLKDKPSLILFGGDHVMDAFEQSRDRTKLQWDIWSRILTAENSIPTMACIGNHDIWGWNQAKSGARALEPDFGKKWAVDALKIPGRYYSFENSGWHFIALDGVQPGTRPAAYAAYLDNEQFGWLEAELAAIPRERPVLIWSHIPIVSAMPMLKRRPGAAGDLTVGPGMTHTDAGSIVDLLVRHPNVKLCLSGHLHQVEHIQIKGISFRCNGAVSGNWWRGPLDGFPEGYAILDLYDDGSHTCEYVAYGWRAGDPAK